MKPDFNQRRAINLGVFPCLMLFHTATDLQLRLAGIVHDHIHTTFRQFFNIGLTRL
jgi:hypothetical protein